MSSEIKNLEPKCLWNNFYSLTQTPRPSKSEAKIQEFLYQFGKKLGLETIKDESGNIIIRKPATPGMENRKGVILQGHMDMVPQKNSGNDHDFEKDPIDACVDGEWVKAKGTTLGADDGIGVAAALTVLADKELKHGPVEVLITTDEETGMTGAVGLKSGVLHGEILLNMDSEEEGELYVGCAGGVDATVHFSYRAEAVPAGHVAYEIGVTGLKGGHSGMDINLGRGNANKLLFRLLKELQHQFGIRLASVSGGSLRNAIPREAFGVVTVEKKNAEALVATVHKIEQTILKELATTDAGLKINATSTKLPAALIDSDTEIKLIHSVCACSNGVERMSDEMPGMVETSSNFAMIHSDSEKKSITLGFLLRSAIDSAKDSLASSIESAFLLAGAKVELTGAYSGWKPNKNSPIMKTMQDTYKKKYGKIPEIKAIHAGLECGILGGKYPNWDMISFGPTIRHPHSPDERVNIASVGKFWDFLVEVLKNVPVK